MPMTTQSRFPASYALAKHGLAPRTGSVFHGRSESGFGADTQTFGGRNDRAQPCGQAAALTSIGEPK